MQAKRTSPSAMLENIEKSLSRQEPKWEEGTNASVVVALRVRGGDIEVLLIKRTVRPEDRWSGHVAFPGGRAEPGEAVYRNVAVREAKEEVGFDVEKSGRFMGYMPVERTDISPMPVVPCVFLLNEDVSIKEDPAEVASHRWVSMSELRKSMSVAEVHDTDGSRMVVSSINLNGNLGVVWGLTYKVIRNVLAYAQITDHA